MQKEQIQRYNKPAARVARMLREKAYYERKYQALGYQAIEVLEHEHQDDRFRIRVRFQAEPALPLPGIARKFVSGVQTVVQEDRWDFTQASGQLLIDIHNLPIKIVASMRLSDAASGAINTLNWDIRCPVPLIGGKLEEIMLAELQARVSFDLQASLPLLGDY